VLLACLRAAAAVAGDPGARLAVMPRSCQWQHVHRVSWADLGTSLLYPCMRRRCHSRSGGSRTERDCSICIELHCAMSSPFTCPAHLCAGDMEAGAGGARQGAHSSSRMQPQSSIRNPTVITPNFSRRRGDGIGRSRTGRGRMATRLRPSSGSRRSRCSSCSCSTSSSNSRCSRWGPRGATQSSIVHTYMNRHI